MQTTTDTVVWASFHPKDYTTVISYGKQHVYFWRLFWDLDNQTTGRLLRDKKSGNFEVRT
jgi:microtubule-associated protein-like 1/2